MLRKIVLAIILLLIFVFTFLFIKEASLNNPEKIYKSIFPKYQKLVNLSTKDKVYSPERKLEYNLLYLGIIPIGKAEISVQDSGNHFLLKALARPNEFIERAYKVEASINSLIDKNNLYPLRYVEIITTPEEEKKKEIIYHQDTQIMESEGKKYKILPKTFCPISLFYFFQTLDLELKKTHELKVASKENTYLFKIEILEKKGNIFKLNGSVRRMDLSSTHGANFTIWLSDDLRIPLLLKVNSPVGVIIMRSKEVK